ncbi:polymerase [Brazoran virus]|uniref:RNA-directed RNA polymerase L n=1 Tax=Brazoran virus TaxID=1368616 RepID=S5WZS9_9VIRU|nr:polymerase [Brazoran virus]AGS94386.1 polymerase [Brazoran virus]
MEPFNLPPRDLVVEYNKLIRQCQDPHTGRDILTAMTMDRHNYFAREYCRAINIEYRDDVPAVDIVMEMVPDLDLGKIEIPDVTPDNYYRDGAKIYIIDFKVSVSDETGQLTYKKYNNIFGDIFNPLGVQYEVVIIRMDPSTMRMTISSDNFMQLFPQVAMNIDFNWYFRLKDSLFDKFRDDEDFLALTSHGEFTPTMPWVTDDTPELADHPIFIEFMESMPIDQQRDFMTAMNYNAFKSEKWSDLLHIYMKRYGQKYEKFIRDQAKEVFLVDGNYNKPTQSEILEGWKEMYTRIQDAREITQDISKQKPSIHFIWTHHDNNKPTGNEAKIIRLAKLLQKIDVNDNASKAFKAMGFLMDFSSDVEKYRNFCSNLKGEARSSIKPKSSRIEPVQINQCTILWEQQFKMDAGIMNKNVRIRFLKDFCGIGGHKNFKDRMIDDIDLGKPRILDFEDKNVIQAAEIMFKQTKGYLSKESGLEKIGNILGEYKDEITGASEKTWLHIESISKSRFWQCINDISVLIKNMLSVSQYNKHHTFRVVTSANNNFFGIVYPSASIKSKQSTIVFSSVCLHQDPYDVLTCGSLYRTYKLGPNEYISISKAIRLDKERCQRLVTSPGLFLMTCLLFKGDNDILLEEIMAFSFFTSLSITKSMLSLTEPSRYMIMNSLALSSHVREYIAEKFAPYTKTLFSVYMTQLIKKGCMSANDQKDKISLKDVFLNEFEITQKGVSMERNLQSIWFPGKVNLQEYIMQVYLPFYFNPKGLHNKHHVMIDLAKTVLEIELEQRIELPNPWSTTFIKQSANLDILIYSIAKMLKMDTAKHNHLRARVESRNNFKRSLTSISTFTSSKSCIKIGDFEEIKSKTVDRLAKLKNKEARRTRVANSDFVAEDEIDLEVAHSNYKDLKKCVPNYTDYMSTKVFDRLYESYRTGLIEDKPAIEVIMKTMKTHTDFKFCFFNKGQKTAKDREIFVGELEAKFCLYAVERIAKERCKLNPEEMISEPGDSKLKKLELNSESEIRYLIDALRDKNKDPDAKLDGIKIEINADMSKWSAQDVFFKYFWLIVLDPILYPKEKKRIIYFFCNYMNKELILPDEMMCSLLDQKAEREDDIIRQMTNGFRTNTVNIKRNWLQGNLNYTSSYVHSCSMMVFKDIIKEMALLLDGQCHVSSMVHSDDNQTSIIMVQDKVNNDMLIHSFCNLFERVCRTFGNQANMKKTYVTNHIKEFVSLFNIYGEPFSIYGRFLLPAVGDCAYIGPYEDMASRLSATQTAIKHGCPPSLAWTSIALNQWVTFSTYNMLPGQTNDPARIFECRRDEIPIELCGLLKSELSTIALVGLESGNISFLTSLIKRMSPVKVLKESIQTQCQFINEWDLEKLTKMDILRLKILRYVVLDSELNEEDKMGETSEMRSRSLITPRKFTTTSSLERLVSYKEFQDIISDQTRSNDLFEYLLAKPELLVTKGEDANEFMTTILYRYNSKKFKESLSIQSPTQLFVEQILFSNKPTIDYSGIYEKIMSAADIPQLQNYTGIIGRKTIPETFKAIQEDLEGLQLTTSDIHMVYSFCILNDPLNTTACNAILLSQVQSLMDRTSMSAITMPEFRSMKLITHSPALVLRAYIHRDFTVGGAVEDMMQRDVFHLEEFIQTTRIREKVERKIQEKNALTPDRDLVFELKEWTKFYQTCYDYIKSTEHKVKVFILPTRAYTAFDFCAAIHGNLMKDKGWYAIHYLKQIVSGSKKAFVSTTPTGEQLVIDECFRLVSHFADTFIDSSSRRYFVQTVVEQFTYKNLPVSELYRKMKNSSQRKHFLPLLFNMKDIKQNDLDKYNADKTANKATWNDWQINRHLNTGPIDLTIKGDTRTMRIVGEDNQLILAELYINEGDYTPPENHARKLLNTKHNLRFEAMKEIPVMEPDCYYICWQKKSKYYTHYQMLLSNVINARNEAQATGANKYNRLIPVCIVHVARVQPESKVLVADLQYMNDIASFTRLKMSETDYAMVRRCHFSKMVFFSGPEIGVGRVNITRLLRNPSLLTINYSSLSQTPLPALIDIFECNGVEIEDDEFNFLSDEILEETETQTINAVPMFNISYSVKTRRGHTYKNAIQEAIARGVNDFEEQFDFSGEGFFSSKGLSICALIVSLIDRCNMTEWSAVIKKCIHLTCYTNGNDRIFHNFKIPRIYLLDPINYTIDWEKVRLFILGIKIRDENNHWGTVFKNFFKDLLDAMDEQRKVEGLSWADLMEQMDEYKGACGIDYQE